MADQWQQVEACKTLLQKWTRYCGNSSLDSVLFVQAQSSAIHSYSIDLSNVISAVSVCRFVREKSVELDNQGTKALPLSPEDRSHSQHQLQLLRADVELKMEEIKSLREQQTRLAGELPADQQLDETRGKLGQLLDKIGGMEKKLNSHNELCQTIVTDQVGPRTFL